MADNIKVVIRARPLSEREATYGEGWSFDKNSVTLYDPAKRQVLDSLRFTFDRVYHGILPTKLIYDDLARDIVHGVQSGINGTIFAYGQTSSGKTHTMMGKPDDPGVILLAINQVFESIEKSLDREWLLRVSYMEIYNETIRDLLSSEAAANLKVHEDPSKGVFVAGLKEEIVTSVDHMLDLLEKGDAQRQVAETNMNEHSSRSHSIFRLVIESRSKSVADADAVRVSMLNLVDLAGSERVKDTSTPKAEGQRLVEGGHINKSLLVLGTVINKLAENAIHIPYRDSKLTRILESSIGGNSRTAIICAVSPAALYREETKSTLMFANRAKEIKNTPVVNEVMDDKAMLKVYKSKIAEMKRQLDSVNDENAHKELEALRDENNRLQADRQSIEGERRDLEEKLKKFRQFILGGAVSHGPKQAKYVKAQRRQTWAPSASSSSVSLFERKPLAVGLVDLDFPDIQAKDAEIPADWLSAQPIDIISDAQVSVSESFLEKQPSEEEPQAEVEMKDALLDDGFGTGFGFEQLLVPTTTKRTADDAFPFTTRPAKKRKSEDFAPPAAEHDEVDLPLRLSELESANAHDKEKDALLSTLQDRVRDLEAQLARSRPEDASRILELEGRLRVLESQQSVSSSPPADALLRAEHDALKSRFAALRASNDELTSKFHAYQQNFEAMALKFTSQSHSMAELRTQLSEEVRKNEQVKLGPQDEMVEIVKADYERKIAELRVLHEETENSLISENSDLRRQLAPGGPSMLIPPPSPSEEDLVSPLRAQIESLTTDLNVARSGWEMAESSARELQSSLHKTQEEVGRLNTRLLEAETTKQTLSPRFESPHEDSSKLEAECEALKAKVNSLQQELVGAESRILTERSNVQSLQDELQQRAALPLEPSVSPLVATGSAEEIAELNEKLREAAANSTHLDSQRGLLQSQVDQLSQALEVATQQITTLQQKTDASETMQQALLVDKEELQALLATAQSASTQLREQLESTSFHKEELQLLCDEAVQKAESAHELETQLNEARKEVSRLARSLEESERSSAEAMEARDLLAAQLQKINMDHSSLVQQVHELAVQARETESLKSQLSELQSISEEFERMCTLQEGEIGALRQTIEQLQANGASPSQVAEGEQRLRAAEARSQSLTSENARLSSELSETKARYEKLTEKVRKEMNEKDSAKANWERSMQLVEQANEKVAFLRNEHASLSTQLNEAKSALAQRSLDDAKMSGLEARIVELEEEVAYRRHEEEQTDEIFKQQEQENLTLKLKKTELEKELSEARSASLSAKALTSAPEVVHLLQRVRALEEENAKLQRTAPAPSQGSQDLLIQLNDLKIKLGEQSAATTKYRNERNQLIKLVQKTSKPFGNVENSKVPKQ